MIVFNVFLVTTPHFTLDDSSTKKYVVLWRCCGIKMKEVLFDHLCFIIRMKVTKKP